MRIGACERKVVTARTKNAEVKTIHSQSDAALVGLSAGASDVSTVFEK